MLDEIMLELQPLIVNAAVVIITTVATAAGTWVHSWIKKKADTEEKKKVIETTVKYVNQVYKDLNGDEKLQKAQEAIVEQLNEKGVKITELELRVMIEAAVNTFKDAVVDGKVDNTPAIEEKSE